MRILFDQSVHDHRNRGNNSLLEVTRDRFRKFWPDARFDVISDSPYFCKVYMEDVHPVDPLTFTEYRGRFDWISKFVPNTIWRLIFETRELLKQISGLRLTSKNARRIFRDSHKGGTTQQPGSQISEDEPAQSEKRIADLQAKFSNYDLYVLTGGGYLCDSDKRFLFPLFDRLKAAQAQNVPTFMVGQGIGPLEDLELLQLAREVLPKLDCLLIREENLTRPLLTCLGVPSEKVLMTGDDAIEPAYLARKDQIGNGIGLSLRVAAYTNFNQSHIAAIRPTILTAARKYRAELISAPIDANDADKEYVSELMKGYSRTSSSWRNFESTSGIIKRIGRCRIMITGTFHGAVFAISQGIPVIGLANSTEYRNKLYGLAAEFGTDGCQIIMLQDENLEENLMKAIDFAWASAERLRFQLLKNAKRQIDLSHAAYQRIYSLVELKRSRQVDN
jgi:colanic acid/amylovoran biosynthesis protein